jgi:hypothetical protein
MSSTYILQKILIIENKLQVTELCSNSREKLTDGRTMDDRQRTLSGDNKNYIDAL